MRLITFAALSASLLITACRSTTVDAPAQPPANSNLVAPENAINDGDAAGIAFAVNAGEIELAKLAKSRAQSAAVRDYAAMMFTEHTKANDTLVADGYGHVNNPVVKTLEETVGATKRQLESTSGTNFDRAYMTSQVDMHTAALEMIRTTLLPSALLTTMRETMETMEQSVEHHLAEARRIRESL